jgi:hypothetical protein
MGLFSTPKVKAPKPTPPTPRLSDTELKGKDEAAQLRKRKGIEDQILSLGRPGVAAGVGDRPARTTSLLGRTAA